MFSEDYEEVKMQERISTAAARGCVERWLIQVCNHDVFIKKKKFHSNTNTNFIHVRERVCATF